MKKLLAVLMAMALCLAFVGCGSTESAPAPESEAAPSESAEAPAESTEAPAESVETPAEAPVEVPAVMTHEEFMAAEVESEVVVETFVQAKQSYYAEKGTATIYAQGEDGAYFLYNAKVSAEDYEKLVPGAKIRAKGFKGEWAGEVEIMDAEVEVLEGSYVAEAIDATELLASEELIKHQNEFASFKGLTVEEVTFKGEKGDGDDIYLKLGLNGASYDFCVESYLTNAESEVYKTALELEAGKVVDVEGFIYWYKGVNPHITSLIVK